MFLSIEKNLNRSGDPLILVISFNQPFHAFPLEYHFVSKHGCTQHNKNCLVVMLLPNYCSEFVIRFVVPIDSEFESQGGFCF